MLERLEQQKSLTLNQWKIISASILGDMLDFFDFFLIGYVLVFIVTQWKLTFIQSGVILLAAGVGAIPGAFFWGWMADRIGRRKVFIATVLNFSLATGIMAADARPVWLDVSGVLPLARRGRRRPGWSSSICRWCRNSCRRRSAALSAAW